MKEQSRCGKNRLGVWYEKWIGWLIPQYAVFSLIGCFTINCLVYTGTQFLMKNAKHYDLTTDLDRAIPFVKEWIVIYLGCFLFWAVNYILISRKGKEQWYRFAAADMFSRLICGVFFIVLPTMNVRPELSGNDIFTAMVRFMYRTDDPVNLFPSIHCLVSWFCFIGIRKSSKIPLWYRSLSCILALLVCASTQFLKQHYLIDIAGGILLAEGCYALFARTNGYLVLMRAFDWVDQKVFYGRQHE